MKFEVIGEIRDVELIARGTNVKIRAYLRKACGRGSRRKLKGIAAVQLANGSRRIVELHWYEAHRIGRKASLIPGKIYRLIPDARAAKDDFVRIVDESGEDYLCHKSHFVFVDFPASVKKQILAIERTG